ncbi:T-cell activation Rho GTPase-activating protein [Trichinella spiralis]|uniref:T-cell activation Rho GTPase-activating protein n=1 Tax=Trichinella spiralis TaxID=6334 RepID=A0ABR3K6W1_TRISP
MFLTFAGTHLFVLGLFGENIPNRTVRINAIPGHAHPALYGRCARVMLEADQFQFTKSSASYSSSTCFSVHHNWRPSQSHTSPQTSPSSNNSSE